MKVGDVVLLLSGGHHMTVQGFEEDTGRVCCTWHSDDGTPEDEEYPRECLNVVRSREED